MAWHRTIARVAAAFLNALYPHLIEQGAVGVLRSVMRPQRGLSKWVLCLVFGLFFLVQTPQFTIAGLPANACDGLFPAAGAVTLCVCDTATGNLIVEGPGGRFLQPNSNLCTPRSSSPEARIDAALASMSANDRADFRALIADFIENQISSGVPTDEIPNIDDAERNLAGTLIGLGDFFNGGFRGDQRRTSDSTDPASFRSQQRFSPAVFHALEHAAQGSANPGRRPGGFADNHSPHSHGIWPASRGHDREAIAAIAEQGWRFTSSARMVHSRDESGPQTESLITASVDVGGHRRLSERIGLAFRASLSGTRGHIASTSDDHTATRLGVTAGLPMRIGHGVHFAPVASYQRGWLSVEETVGGNQTTADLDAHTFSLGAIASRRWTWTDYESQALYFLEPSVTVLQSWQHVDSYRRSDGQQFASQTNSSGEINLSLTAGTILQTDWASIAAIQPSLQLEAGYVYGDKAANGPEGAATARLRFFTRSSLTADVSMGYRMGNERQTVFARAALRVPLQP